MTQQPPAEECCPVDLAEACDGKLALPEGARGGPVSHAIFRVARLHRMIAGQLLRRTGLHPGQELVMMYLWELGPQRQVDLIRLLDSDAATMTRTVRRLEHAGFVRRCPCATDKRVVIIEATVASQALRREVEQVWQRFEEITVGGLSEDERAEALRTLEQLEQNLLDVVGSGRCGEATAS
ncbi:MarR family winged helix-turn-helix transcriptional regulator [Streptoalloteichus hindustanus]|uniref:DNA-binding transcriptional regulator, MarR family n=1 Tax=Streptoalloteichus hindustanus TaxID=2017 RepID=A0A1M4ZCU9_STRHI|nr:MarR family winged helix-turn-helix transcriptional regulator [Streptoalloteichus hindustanus]SHF15617.1 DNA-binding transcriptional regulator, MarR family [Streptoalloteichus hindustanus]